MGIEIHDIGIAKNLGRYSDALEVSDGRRWLFTAGTPGMTPDGHVPAGIEAQTRLCWENIRRALAAAQMTFVDLVKVTTTLVDAKDVAPYAQIRAEILGDLRPTFMLQVVNQLVRPELLVEVEVIAAKT